MSSEKGRMGQRKFGKDEEKRIRAEIFSQGPEDAGIIPGIMTSGPETATPETMGPEETVTPEAMVAPETTAPETTTEDG